MAAGTPVPVSVLGGAQRGCGADRRGSGHRVRGPTRRVGGSRRGPSPRWPRNGDRRLRARRRELPASACANGSRLATTVLRRCRSPTTDSGSSPSSSGLILDQGVAGTRSSSPTTALWIALRRSWPTWRSTGASIRFLLGEGPSASPPTSSAGPSPLPGEVVVSPTRMMSGRWLGRCRARRSRRSACHTGRAQRRPHR